MQGNIPNSKPRRSPRIEEARLQELAKTEAHNFKPRRSPRIEEARLRHLDETEKDNQRHCQSQESPQQRASRLQRRRAMYKATQESMTAVEHEALLEKWRQANYRRKKRIGCSNKHDHTAETCEPLPTITQARSHDREAGTSTSSDQLPPTAQVITETVRSTGIRRSLEIIQQLRHPESAATSIERETLQVSDSVGGYRAETNLKPLQSPRTIALQKKELQLEKRRRAEMEIRASMTENEKESIRKKRRTTYEIKKTRVCAAAIVIRSPQILSQQGERRDEPESRASRKGKGKSIAHDDQPQKPPRKKPRTGQHEAESSNANEQVSASNQASQATRVPLRRSPRFTPQPQHTEPVPTQNATAANVHHPSNLNRRRSPRIMQLARQHPENPILNPQRLQVGRGIGRPRRDVAGRSSVLNCARGLTYQDGYTRFHLPPTGTCTMCGAKTFYREPTGFCCSNGKVVLSYVAPPAELLQLYDDQTPRGVHFRNHIRGYNQVFSFTSIGVDYDRDLANSREGVYTFRVHGSIYHRIGSLLPAPAPATEEVRPRYLQMYIFDTANEMTWRMQEGNNELDRDVLELLRTILDRDNRFVHVIRPLGQREDIQNCRLVIKEQPAGQRQYTLPTADQVAAIVVEDSILGERDIVVHTTAGQPLFIKETAGYYDPLQYPLLLPYGSYGWDQNSRDEMDREITCLEFYCYMLQIRSNEPSLFLRGGRLLQQYAVDNWVKIDTFRLRWLQTHQEEVRADFYKGLEDARNAGEVNGRNLGQRTILPSSYMGGPRDMQQRYRDAMALVQKFGKPALFITMTCNPDWPEIVAELEPGQTAANRPDLTTRVFRAKLEELKVDLFTKSIFGIVSAQVHVVEFQKRGLPHVHMLLILSPEFGLKGPDDYDEIVRAEIPDPVREPELYESVKKHMIHGPCGSKCMREGKCKRGFPKQFSRCTMQGKDAFPVYQRREDGRSVHVRNFDADNRFVVPYNAWLIQKYDCHINVEICSSVESVKYLFKYVYKGPDFISFQVHPELQNDEIERYKHARWVCAQEAMWRIFSFALYKIYPSVQRLHIHLPNQQSVTFYDYESLDDILSNERNLRTTLTEFFVTNSRDPRAREVLYRDFPEYYCWDKIKKEWNRRRSTRKAIGRVYTVPPFAGEVWYLRHILNHVRGPTCFDDLLLVDGERCMTFKKAAQKLGLLENDNSVRAGLAEAATVKMPCALRRYFASVLAFCNPTGVRELWDEFFNNMVEDYSSSSNTRSAFLSDRLLHELNLILKQHDKDISMYDLPPIVGALGDDFESSGLIQEELSIPVSEEDLSSVHKLNEDQSKAYDTIMGAIERKESKVFFIDGPGGTGKTFLYRAILSTVRNNGGIAIATATSGIAATMLPGGRTAHSRFKLPMSPTTTSMCRMTVQSNEAKLLKQATVLMWDEATMTHRYSLEAFDRTMRDVTKVDEPFGGKILIMGGDFRQVLPVIPRSTRGQTVDACLSRSPLWEKVQVLHLKKNMRAAGDASYSEFLMRVGDGDEPCVANEMIKVPEEMVIPWVGDDPVSRLINVTFPNLEENARDINYMVNRALITPLNEYVEKLNDRVLSIFPGEEVIYYSFDSVANDTHHLYQQEYLNSIAPGGLPAHILKLKLGAPIMLLRNVDPKNGLCNGTRLVIKGFFPNCIDAEVISGNCIGTRVFIHRMPLEPPENLKLPYEFKRKQFPIRLCFAFTVNKAQGQTIENTGIFFPEHVFSHGQLYVALSRGISSSKTKVLVAKGVVGKREGTFTKNVVYKEVFL